MWESDENIYRDFYDNINKHINFETVYIIYNISYIIYQYLTKLHIKRFLADRIMYRLIFLPD